LYADAEGTQAIANPITLLSRGNVPNVFYEGTARAVLFDAEGNQQFDVDPIAGAAGGSGGFSLFDVTTAYATDAIVLATDGMFYISLQDENQGNDPVDSVNDNPYWSQVIIFERWNAEKTYQPNDMVVRGTRVFYSESADNLNNDPLQFTTGIWRSIADAVNVVYSNIGSGLVAITSQGAIDELKR
jgi:hypothetical protein